MTSFPQCGRPPARWALKFMFMPAASVADFDAAFATLARQRAAGLVINSDIFFSSRAEQLAELALRQRVPAISQFREFVAAGGLMSYGGGVTVRSAPSASTLAAFSKARNRPT